MHNGVHPKSSKSMLKADRPEHSNIFNHKNDSGKIASCWAVTGCKLLTSPAVAARYRFLMPIWNTLRESYQQRVYNNTHSTVKSQINPAENQTPTVVISMDGAHVNNAILLKYLASKVALEELEIGSTDPNILTDQNCTDDEGHFGNPGGSGFYVDAGDESDDFNAIPTASRRQQYSTELERSHWGTSDVAG